MSKEYIDRWENEGGYVPRNSPEILWEEVLKEHEKAFARTKEILIEETIDNLQSYLMWLRNEEKDGYSLLSNARDNLHFALNYRGREAAMKEVITNYYERQIIERG